MKKYFTKALACLIGLLTLSIGLFANADAEFGISEIGANTYSFNVRASTVTLPWTLESAPGNGLSVFRVSLKFPAGSTTILSTATGAAPFGGLVPTGPNSDATGEYYTYSYSGGSTPVVIPTSGDWVTLFTFVTTGASAPVLWASGDPTVIAAIGVDNLFQAFAPSSAGENNNYIINAVVPVELTQFDVVKRNRTEGLVSWQTASEQNTAQFEVERSTDGKSWARIGTVAAEGFTDLTQDYSYLDKYASINTSFSGDVFYRLRIMDFDGYQEYTTVKKINFRQIDSRIIAFPNPASSYTTVSGLVNDASYTLVSKEGKIAKSGNFFAGDNQLDLDNVPAGVYIINIDMGSESIQIPIVKTK